MRATTRRAVGWVTALLLLAAVAGCTSSTSSPGVEGSPLDLPLPSAPGDPVLPEECGSAELDAYCTAIANLGSIHFVSRMPLAEPLGPPEITVLPSRRVRYLLRQRAPGGRDSSIIDDYEFVFDRWDSVHESRDLLVYRKRNLGILLEARMRLVPDGERYLLEATLTTVEPAAAE